MREEKYLSIFIQGIYAKGSVWYSYTIYAFLLRSSYLCYCLPLLLLNSFCDTHWHLDRSTFMEGFGHVARG